MTESLYKWSSYLPSFTATQTPNTLKTTFLALCLFLFAYKATSSVIVDTNNNPVRNGGDAYYLIPVSNELSGGLALATVGNEAEPKAVVFDTDKSPGLPVRFESSYKTAFITSSFFLNIRFVSSSSDLGVWDVSQEFPIGWAVRVSDTITGPFRVESARGGYKIVYYPDQGETGGDIGLVHRDGKYRLAVKDGQPFIFQIKKAIDDESSAAIMSISVVFYLVLLYVDKFL
ncbi:hypothetical protein L6164_037117 [Bauhinia variegata]|uniref:Uncharacterized protein n=1 Tax=Bauhinia variegata TaxID=167791 RepID=A0ACB9KJW0_BAUVA|nr:hypothetical protein L6164_037117 [Bauhinia variegata]